ncbi:MAG: YhbY family RNA-binding protein [Hydrogenophilus sp.]|nr:YhbY family RNA-binding protein [Hydrogenophilus sp.]
MMGHPLTAVERRALRAAAHRLKPVVLIRRKGLTPAVMAEIDRALTAHALIKIRIDHADRNQREALLTEICATLDAVLVQHLGRVITLWRPRPVASPAASSPPSPLPYS